MSYVGLNFDIRLRGDTSEHENELLRAHDGEMCRLVSIVRGTMYATDIRVPEGTPDSDYAHEGYLLVMVEKDGNLTPVPKSRRRKS